MFQDECIIVGNHTSSFTPYKVFESYADMHNYYGLSNIKRPNTNDIVIPNYFNPDDFDFKDKKEDYFLYLGKITKDKGVEMIIWLAKKTGIRLIIAGQGDIEKEIGDEGRELPCNIEYYGFIDLEKRKMLLANAKALFLCTQNIESFGAVVVEAMMSGTPVITSDHGAFAETVLHEITGYRCHTVDHYEWAINNIHKINSQDCRDWALNNYSFKKIRTMYEEYFDLMIKYKFHGGFYADNLNRNEMSWLGKRYPNNNNYIPIVKPKLAIVTESRWAFGRIANALQKYSRKFDIRVFNWSKQQDLVRLDKCDLIYTTLINTTWVFERQFPELKNKIIFSGHGLTDFFISNIDNHTHIPFTKEIINNFSIDTKVIAWMNNRNQPMSMVSHQLFDKLTTITGIHPNKIQVTQQGVDTDIFFPNKNIIQNDKLRVVFTFPERDTLNVFGYDQKRKALIKIIKDKIIEEDLPIEIIFSTTYLHLTDMPDFYKKGDVFIVISHSEGGPLGVLEAGACGLVVIGTKVGEIPYIVIDEETGFLLDNDSDEQVMKDVIDKLMILANDRDKLQKMKNNMIDHIKNNWKWEDKISQWDNFFESCLLKINQ